ncbi:MAG: VCBS repeat-containing protein [Verrucomicrobiota bacterium]
MKTFCLTRRLADTIPLLIISLFALLLFSCGDAGNRPWASHAISVSVGTSSEILALELVDLNQDGRHEIIVSRKESDVIYLYGSQWSEEGVLLWKEHQIPAIAGIHKFHIWQAGTRKNPQWFLVAAAGEPALQVLISPIPDLNAIYYADEWVFTELPIPAGDWSALNSGDFNNDGVGDLALAGRSGGEFGSAPEIIWMSDVQSGERTTVTIGESASPLLMYADDVEQDGDIDLLVVDAAPGANSMGAYWLENPWPENPDVNWKRNFITLSSLQPAGATVVDFDGDRRLDLLMCLQEKTGANRLICFKKVTASAEVAWLPLPLPISGKQGKLMHTNVADVDQDGSNDLVLGFSGAPDPLEHLSWLRNPTPEAASPAWIRRRLSEGRNSVSSDAMLICDVDGDGDLDVVSADAGGSLRWYENNVPVAATPKPSESESP